MGSVGTSQIEPEDTARTRPRSRARALWWALAFAALTTLGLVFLVWMLFMLDGMVSFIMSLAKSSEWTPPDDERYGYAFLGGLVVNFGMAAALARLAGHTSIRSWPESMQGLIAGLCGGVAGASVLLLMLGISPVDFMFSF